MAMRDEKCTKPEAAEIWLMLFTNLRSCNFEMDWNLLNFVSNADCTRCFCFFCVCLLGVGLAPNCSGHLTMPSMPPMTMMTMLVGGGADGGKKKGEGKRKKRKKRKKKKKKKKKRERGWGETSGSSC